MSERQDDLPKGWSGETASVGEGERRPRVLLIANTLPPTDVSGVGEQVVQLAAGLREAGCEVEVLGRMDPARRKRPEAEGARGPKILFPLTIVAPALRSVARFRPDVVQVHESDGALALWAIARRRRRQRRRDDQHNQATRPRLFALLQVSYVEERHAVRPLLDGSQIIGRPSRIERRFRWLKAPLQILLGRWTARTADRILVPSVRTGEEIDRDYLSTGVHRASLTGIATSLLSPISVLPNVTGGLGIVAEKPSPNLRRGDQGLAPLLFVGRLRIRKGVEVLFAALARRREAGGDLPPVWVVGDGEHRAALETARRDFGLESTVKFLGRRSAGAVRGLLGEAAALVVPSTYEGMPLVILEAMEAGCPVVGSAVSGIPEVVIDGETGWLVAPEDALALAAALGEVLDDPEIARQRGEAGRQRLDRLYRPANAARAWLEIFRSEQLGTSMAAAGADVEEIGPVGRE